MTEKQINIDPKEKTIDIFVDDITVEQLKDILKDFKGMDDYEFRIHNTNQSTNLIHEYYGNILIDNLYKIK